MDEYGETPKFYIWPEGHEEGTALPEDFYTRLCSLLRDNGFDFEEI